MLAEKMARCAEKCSRDRGRRRKTRYGSNSYLKTLSQMVTINFGVARVLMTVSVATW